MSSIILRLIVVGLSFFLAQHTSAMTEERCVRIEMTEAEGRQAPALVQAFEEEMRAWRGAPGQTGFDLVLVKQTLRKLRADLSGLARTDLSDAERRRIASVFGRQQPAESELWSLLARWEKMAGLAGDVGTVVHMLLLSEDIARKQGIRSIPVQWRLERSCLLERFLDQAPPSDWGDTQRLTDFAAWFVDPKVGAGDFPEAVRLDIQARLLDWILALDDLRGGALFLATDLLSGEMSGALRQADVRLLDAVVTRAQGLRGELGEGDCGRLDGTLELAVLDAYQAGHIAHGDAMVSILSDAADTLSTDPARQSRIGVEISRLREVRARVVRDLGRSVPTHSGD